MIEPGRTGLEPNVAAANLLSGVAAPDATRARQAGISRIQDNDTAELLEYFLLESCTLAVKEIIRTTSCVTEAYES